MYFVPPMVEFLRKYALTVVIVNCLGCVVAEKSRSPALMTWEDYVSLAEEDMADDNVCRRFVAFCQDNDRKIWEDKPIWVLANIEFIPLGNHIEQVVIVDHVYCERLLVGLARINSFAPPISMRVANSDESWIHSIKQLHVSRFGFYSIRCAVRIVPIKEINGDDVALFCKVVSAYALDAPENHILEVLDAKH